MECNRDEAIRARDIAVGKFGTQDFLGAKKFILKAQQLYPPLEGATQMLAVVDVHIAAQMKVGVNETDWYGILQVEPASDENIIKKQYRRLALMLHPDKNQYTGAEAAFKLIGEAFAILSDKNKRSLHDSKRVTDPRVARMPSHSTANAVYQAQFRAAAQANPAAARAQSPHLSRTFWTACPLCRMQYQYMRTYLNQTLLCQKCAKPFVANDIHASGANGTTTFTWNNGPFPAGPVPPAPGRAGVFNFQAWSQNGGVAGNAAANGHSRGPGGVYAAGAGTFPPGGTAGAGASAAAANMAQEMYQRAQRERLAREKAEAELKKKAKEEEKVARKEASKKARESAKVQEELQRQRRKRDEALKKVGKSGTRKRLRKRRDNDDEVDEEDEDEGDVERSNSGCGIQADLTRKSSRHRRNVAYGVDDAPSEDDDFVAYPEAKKSRTTANGGDVGQDTRVEKGKSVMHDDGVERRVDDGAFGSEAAAVRDHVGQLAESFRNHLKNTLRQVPQAPGANASFASGDANSVHHVGVSSAGNGKDDQKKADNGAAEGESGEAVPDADFHDFDADRTEQHVKKNQVWAIYDGTEGSDGMPRFYCQINKVTRSPFSVYAVWLEPTHPQKDTFTWLKDRELSIGTGEFRLGDETDFDSINLFSQLMAAKKTRNGYEIYPKKPEVWAVYRDYDKETVTDAEGCLKLRYDLVLVMTDFLPMTGQGRVVGLQKLSGYKTLWVPHGEPYDLTVKYDLQKFSHRVPALCVSETDVKGVPAGCLDLDPASTPSYAINSGASLG